MNVWKLGSSLAHRRDDEVEISCTDPRKFQRRSAVELEETIDLLNMAKTQCENGQMTQTRFEQLQKAAGLNACPDSFMADQHLRLYVKPTEIIRIDWVHCCLQDGVLSVEVHAFLKAAKIPYSRLETYLRAD